MTITRYGVERYLRGVLAHIPADARAFAEPEVGGAFVEGIERARSGRAGSRRLRLAAKKQTSIN